MIALVLPQPVLARNELHCATTKLTITNSPGRGESTCIEEHLSFLIDDAEKTFAFSDGRRLRTIRFAHSCISADRDDIRYEFNRGDSTFTYAGSTTEGSVTITIVGSGRCESPLTGEAQ